MAKIILNDIPLDKDGIDTISEQLQEWLAQAKTERKNIIRMRLAMEDLLEDLCTHFEGKGTVSLQMEHRFSQIVITLRYGGEAWRPQQNTGTQEFSALLLSRVGLFPAWRCRDGTNELTLKISGGGIRSEVWLVIAFVSAVILGLCRPVLPSGLTEFLSTWVFSNLSAVFMNLLGTFAGILVFLSVIAGICGIGSIADFSRMGKYLIIRTIVNSFIGAGIAAAVMIPCFSFAYGSGGGSGDLGSVVRMILEIIPSDPITPFQTGNTLQIVFMAVVIGAMAVMLGSRTEKLRALLAEVNQLILHIVSAVCRFLPVYIFASLTLMFWQNGMEIFATIWKPLVLIMALSWMLGIFSLVSVSLRFKVPFAKLLKKVLPGYLIGITTASSTAAFGTILEENEKGLGIDPQLSNFGTPLQMILNSSTMSSGFLAVLYFLAEYSGIEVTPVWFVSAWILITIISFALPPVSGGTLIGLSVILAQFSIPSECLGMAGTMVLLGDFFMTSARIIILQMELVYEAAHWQMLDRDRLKA